MSVPPAERPSAERPSAERPSAGRPALRVALDSIPPEGLKLILNVGPKAMAALTAGPGEEAPTFTAALTGVLHLRRLNAGLEAKGSFQTGVALACDRCLAPTSIALTGEIDDLLPLGGPEGGEDGGLPVTDGQADLASFLAESFWLAWPYRFICRPDCAGLCLTCGADLNQGPCGCLGSKVAGWPA